MDLLGHTSDISLFQKPSHLFILLMVMGLRMRTVQEEIVFDRENALETQQFPTGLRLWKSENVL